VVSVYKYDAFIWNTLEKYHANCQQMVAMLTNYLYHSQLREIFAFDFLLKIE
jgi:hypothetical protein